MISTIDSAGRVVIPKSIRAKLGLTGGQRISIRERDGSIEIEPAATPMRLAEGTEGPVAVPDDELPPLTDEIVRDTLDHTRR